VGERMSINGKQLSRASDRLSEIKRQNELELIRRREEVYARLPKILDLEMQLKKLMAGVIRLALKQGADVGKAMDGIEKQSLGLQAERAELLVGAGYPAEYLDEIYSCPKCRDTGYIKGVMCSCLKELYEQERAKDMSCLLKLGKECFENFDLGYYDCVPDPVSGVSQRKLMEVVLTACKTYAQKFGKDSVNLLFRGDTGLGKTFLSACIAKVVSDRGFSVVYEPVVSAIEAFEIQKFSRNPDESEAAASKVHKILDCDLLIIDDLGTEMITAFSQSALYTIINQRLLSSKKTLISTNLTDDELTRNYMSQIVSRLFGEYTQYKFYGTDIRTRKKD
jgi:DNA replication protein DnaC